MSIQTSRPLSRALFVKEFPRCHLLVVGDVMLDAYIAGSADRISPESPVPVVSVKTTHSVPGGAANVAANARALGAWVTLVGVVGEDQSAELLRKHLENRGVLATFVSDPLRRTTTKTRVTAYGQQIVRFDEENTDSLPTNVHTMLLRHCSESLLSANACVVSDYAKGVVDVSLCREVILRANDCKIPVIVDPKSKDFSRYRGASVVTPNQREASEAADHPIRTKSDLNDVAERLCAAIGPSSTLLITQGKDGMTLFTKDGSTHFPALIQEVADVTGAGDTVAATLAVGLAAGLQIEDAVEIANLAAAFSVSHSGTWAVTLDELSAAMI